MFNPTRRQRIEESIARHLANDCLSLPTKPGETPERIPIWWSIDYYNRNDGLQDPIVSLEPIFARARHILALRGSSGVATLPLEAWEEEELTETDLLLALFKGSHRGLTPIVMLHHPAFQDRTSTGKTIIQMAGARWQHLLNDEVPSQSKMELQTTNLQQTEKNLESMRVDQSSVSTEHESQAQEDLSKMQSRRQSIEKILSEIRNPHEYWRYSPPLPSPLIQEDPQQPYVPSAGLKQRM